MTATRLVFPALLFVMLVSGYLGLILLGLVAIVEIGHIRRWPVWVMGLVLLAAFVLVPTVLLD
jgi:hypothetical protein